MAATIKKRFNVRPEMIEGKGGVYKVWANDRLLFDKHEVGRFPEDEELLPMLEAAAKGTV